MDLTRSLVDQLGKDLPPSLSADRHFEDEDGAAALSVAKTERAFYLAGAVLHVSQTEPILVQQVHGGIGTVVLGPKLHVGHSSGYRRVP